VEVRERPELALIRLSSAPAQTNTSNSPATPRQPAAPQVQPRAGRRGRARTRTHTLMRYIGNERGRYPCGGGRCDIRYQSKHILKTLMRVRAGARARVAIRAEPSRRPPPARLVTRRDTATPRARPRPPPVPQHRRPRRHGCAGRSPTPRRADLEGVPVGRRALPGQQDRRRGRAAQRRPRRPMHGTPRRPPRAADRERAQVRPRKPTAQPRAPGSRPHPRGGHRPRPPHRHTPRRPSGPRRPRPRPGSPRGWGRRPGVSPGRHSAARGRHQAAGTAREPGRTTAAGDVMDLRAHGYRPPTASWHACHPPRGSRHRSGVAASGRTARAAVLLAKTRTAAVWCTPPTTDGRRPRTSAQATVTRRVIVR